MIDETVKFRLAAGELAEKRMIDFLLGFDPCLELKISDVKVIAHWARVLAFDATCDFYAKDQTP